MQTKELKKYIFENSKIDFILEQLGCGNIVYHENHNYFSASWHDGDNPQGINIKNNEWLNIRSYTRGISYEDNRDIFSLVELSKGLTFVDSVKYLHDILGLDYSFKKVKKAKNKKTPLENQKDILSVFTNRKSRFDKFDVNDYTFLDEETLNDYFPILHIDWVREGIMSWTRKKFGLLYSYRRNRMIVPLRYWLTGELLGTNARTMIPNYEDLGIKKYFITPSYPKQANIFGLYENMETIKKKGYVVVYEAEKSVLKRDSKGDSTGVALSGHILSDEQASILLGLDVDIIFAMDKDVSIEEILYMCEKVYCFKNNVYYMYDDLDLLDKKESPADTPNVIYDLLFDRKVLFDNKKHREVLSFMNDKKKGKVNKND